MELRIAKLGQSSLEDLCRRYDHIPAHLDMRYPLTDLVNKLSTLREPVILHQQLSSDLTTHVSLGKELLHESSLHSGLVQLRTFLNWVHTQNLALKVIERIS